MVNQVGIGNNSHFLLEWFRRVAHTLDVARLNPNFPIFVKFYQHSHITPSRTQILPVHPGAGSWDFPKFSIFYRSCELHLVSPGRIGMPALPNFSNCARSWVEAQNMAAAPGASSAGKFFQFYQQLAAAIISSNWIVKTLSKSTLDKIQNL